MLSQSLYIQTCGKIDRWDDDKVIKNRHPIAGDGKFTKIVPWKLAYIDPIKKKKKRHRQGHLIQAHIHPLSNCKDTGKVPFSLHNSKHTKQTHATRAQSTTLYSDGTTRSKQHRKKWVQPNGSTCTNNHRSPRYEQSFRHNKHTHTYQKAATDHDSRYNH